MLETKIQPSPVKTPRSIPVLERVLSYLKQRAELGKAKYKEPLSGHNRRKQIYDIRDELGDALVYIEALIAEMESEEYYNDKYFEVERVYQFTFHRQTYHVTSACETLGIYMCELKALDFDKKITIFLHDGKWSVVKPASFPDGAIQRYFGAGVEYINKNGHPED